MLPLSQNMGGGDTVYSLVKLILAKADERETVQGPSLGAVGQKLKKAAESYFENFEENRDADPDDTEVALKIRKLREAEKVGDLAWCPYSTWYSLTLDFQATFIFHINPLLWSGVFFSYKDFEDKLPTILGHLQAGEALSFAKDHTSRIMLYSGSTKSLRTVHNARERAVLKSFTRKGEVA